MSPQTTTASPPPTTSTESSIDAKLAAAEANLQRACGWIVAADQKASLLLAFAGVILGAGLVQFAVLQEATGASQPTGYRITVAAFLLIALLTTVAGTVWSLRSGWPRTTSDGTSLSYFGTIQAKTAAAFVTAFTEQTQEERLRDLLEQVHVNSGIAHQKHSLLSRAFALVTSGLFAWVFLFLTLVWA